MNLESLINVFVCFVRNFYNKNQKNTYCMIAIGISTLQFLPEVIQIWSFEGFLKGVAG